MVSRPFLAAIAVAALGAVSAARAEGRPDAAHADLDALNKAFGARIDEVLQAQTAQVVQAVKGSPQAMAAFRAGRCGRGLTLRQFALRYTATGGCDGSRPHDAGGHCVHVDNACHFECGECGGSAALATRPYGSWRVGQYYLGPDGSYRRVP